VFDVVAVAPPYSSFSFCWVWGSCILDAFTRFSHMPSLFLFFLARHYGLYEQDGYDFMIFLFNGGYPCFYWFLTRSTLHCSSLFVLERVPRVIHLLRLHFSISVVHVIHVSCTTIKVEIFTMHHYEYSHHPFAVRCKAHYSRLHNYSSRLLYTMKFPIE
jgi:hypothetical protein